MADLSGSWTGTYWQSDQATRFEATFTQGNNSLSGRIQDDGELGEAQVVGEVVGRRVMFTKTYLSGGFPAIEYVGTIDDGGDSLRGNWTIPGRKDQGQWEARRSGDDLMQQLRRRIEQQTPVGAR
jgi:hypothetical protein